MEQSKAKIKMFLSRFFKSRELQDEDDIFALGFVNSLFAMQLVMFLEKEFNIVMEPGDLDIDHFRTIKAIVNFVDSKADVNVS
ncbi:acyl carrier protein [Paenibacillus lutrae]|uniref:Acyl carrier protein n=1 Tax=Paenibacillus lutrae TaxID=2078573 RepID=A0A7X3FF90_9BACL|nr:acyl carrier protein [Paenibacillus lutrae]MVO98618.1 acyl carrier protein [Paenibacillus lutrae]